MADLGAHTHVVQEVIDWTAGTQPFSARVVAGERPDLLVLNDLSRAYEVANMEESDGKPDAPSSSWRIMLEYHRSLFSSTPAAEAHRRAVSRSFGPCYSRWCASPPAGVSGEDFAEVAEWAQMDLRAIALHRAIFGRLAQSFFESLFAVYEQGFWPCGWQDFVEEEEDSWPIPGRFIAWCLAPAS